MSLCKLFQTPESHPLSCLWRERGRSGLQLSSSRRGRFFFSCVGRVCWVVPQLEGRFLPPEVMMIHAESRLHICLLGGSGRGKQTRCVSVGRGCLRNRDGVAGRESGELTVCRCCLCAEAAEADYRAGSRGPGCGCKDPGTCALDCQGGGDGYPGDRARKWVSLAGKNAGKKYNKHWLKRLSPSFLFLGWSTG